MKVSTCLAISFVLLGLSASTSTSRAQTARVIALSAADAAEAKAVYDQQATLDKRKAELEQRIIKNYLHGLSFGTNTWQPDASTGWPSTGFEYSTDFKFIVPKIAASGVISIGGYSPCSIGMPYPTGVAGNVWLSPTVGRTTWLSPTVGISYPPGAIQ